MSCKPFLGCNIFCFREFQINVGFCTSHLLSAVSERACTVFPAGITSDGILMAALTGGSGARTKFAEHGKGSKISSRLHTSPETPETADEAFPRPRNAAKFGCDPRAAASLKQTNHCVKKFVITEMINPPALCSRASLEAICYLQSSHVTTSVERWESRTRHYLSIHA